jgi:DNA-directed RNA polymerase
VKKESLGPIVIMEMLRSINSGGISDGMRTTRLLINIGNAVEREYNLHRASEREKKALEGLKISPELHKNKPSAIVDLRKAINDSDEAEIQNSVTWPLYVRTKIATLLVSYVLNTAKVTAWETKWDV